MRVKVLGTFLDGRDRYEAGDERTVDEREARVAAREEAVEPVVAAPAVELEAVLPALVEPGVGLERMAGPAPAVASDAIALPAEAPEVQDLTAVREEARRARQEREMQLILTALLMAA